jgi:hypothetical protein
MLHSETAREKREQKMTTSREFEPPGSPYQTIRHSVDSHGNFSKIESTRQALMISLLVNF